MPYAWGFTYTTPYRYSFVKSGVSETPRVRHPRRANHRIVSGETLKASKWPLQEVWSLLRRLHHLLVEFDRKFVGVLRLNLPHCRRPLTTETHYFRLRIFL